MYAAALWGCEKEKRNSEPVPDPKPIIDASPAIDAKIATDASAPDAASPLDASPDVPEEEWATCNVADECTYAFDSCGQTKHPVNKVFENRLQKKLNAACKNQPIMALLSVMPTMECVEGQCKLGGMDSIGSALEGAFSDGLGESVKKKPKRKK